MLKRGLDILGALLGLVLLSPLFGLIALAIVIDSGPPIFYRGKRIGKDGRSFDMLKFRTMRPGSDAQRALTVAGDPRVTGIGHVLRKTKLDELPQLLNVLRGTMSFVGPRPEAPRYVAFYSAEQRHVLSVRPGITGLAQVIFRHEEDLLAGNDPEREYLSAILPTKLLIDREYVNHHPWYRDIQILWMTLVALVRPVQPQRILMPETMARIHFQQSRGRRNHASMVLSPQPHGHVMDREAAPQSLLERFHAFIIPRTRLYGAVFLLDILVVSGVFLGVSAVQQVLQGQRFSIQSLYYGAATLAGVIYALTAYALGTHRRLWRFAGVNDVLALAKTVAIAFLIIGILDAIVAHSTRWLPLGIVVASAPATLSMIGFIKLLPRLLAGHTRTPSPLPVMRVLIAGAGHKGANLAAHLMRERDPQYQIIGFVDDDREKIHRQLLDFPILGTIAEIPDIVRQEQVDLVAIAMPSAGSQRISEAITICQSTPAQIKIVPGFQEVLTQEGQRSFLREVNITDLLGRTIVALPTSEAQAILQGKVILVTGAAGSIGAELCRQLLDYHPAALIALDSNETGLFDLAMNLAAQPHADRLRLAIGDITRGSDMQRLFQTEHPQVIFHAAAYKHVPLLEEHPVQAIQTNVLATLSLCQLANRHHVEHFIFISSDKAAEPISVLGASKRLGEMIIKSIAHVGGTTCYCAVRFGNVIGSRGSVVPIFTRQLELGKPLTVTAPEVTRYFMTVGEACHLVIVTSVFQHSGALYVLDMGEPVRIADLARKMIRLRGLRVGEDIPIVYTGLRAGEKMHERLTDPSEVLESTGYAKLMRVAATSESVEVERLHLSFEQLHAALDVADQATLRHIVLELATAPVAAR